MKYFKPSEFQGFFPRLHPDLVLYLDLFREAWGAPVSVSPAVGAVGRTTGSGYHNYVLHGCVMAVDVMPDFSDGRTLKEAYYCAKGLEKFSGIGAYPDWKPRPGLHLDVRPDRSPLNPATWAGVKNDKGKQVYVGVLEAFE